MTDSRYISSFEELSFDDSGPSRDYSQLETALNDLEDQALGSLGPAIEESRDRFLAYVAKSLGPDGPRDRAAWLERLDLKGWGPAQDAFGEMLRQGWEHGRRYARAVAPSIRTMATPTSFAPRASLEWLKSKQLYVSGVAKDDLLKRAKGLILQALKTGESEDKTMEKLRAAWAPYVGSKVDPAAMVRLRTIVRTNTTEALNEGIVTEARSPDMKGVVKALVYVAVLDSRTTPICEMLHGTQIWPDDPRLDAIVPPNHFNCRSILDPVIDDDEYDPDALLSVAKYQAAVSLVQPGFGGDRAVNLSQLEALE
jgi:SPP1 gp7 family putative phage head morphogenesis protein